MRPSLALLLMVVAACCVPNSATEPDPLKKEKILSNPPNLSECVSLGNITHADFVTHKPYSPLKAHTSAKVIDNRVVCSGDTPILFFVAINGLIQPASTIECKDGKWFAEGPYGEESFDTTEVCCSGRIACAPLGEITQDEVNAEFPDSVNVRSSPTVIDGRVSCSDAATPNLFYLAKEEDMSSAAFIQFTGGQWYVDGISHEEMLNTTRVVCMDTDEKTKPQYEEPKKCAPPANFTETEATNKIPDYFNERSTAKVEGVNVICTDATPTIAYIANDGEMMYTDEIVCKEGQWYVPGPEEVLETPKVCCIGSS